MSKRNANGNGDGASAPDANPMEAFFTAQKAAAGAKLYLEDVAGRRTEHWLLIRGADSEEFRLVDAAGKREAVRLSSITDATERDRKVMELTRRMAATLVMDWSFPQPCTLDNVIAFFKEAPQIERKVDMAASSRMLFSKVELDSSSATPGQSTNSTESQPAASKPSGQR